MVPAVEGLSGVVIALLVLVAVLVKSSASSCPLPPWQLSPSCPWYQQHQCARALETLRVRLRPWGNGDTGTPQPPMMASLAHAALVALDVQLIPSLVRCRHWPAVCVLLPRLVCACPRVGGRGHGAVLRAPPDRLRA